MRALRDCLLVARPDVGLVPGALAIDVGAVEHDDARAGVGGGAEHGRGAVELVRWIVHRVDVAGQHLTQRQDRHGVERFDRTLCRRVEPPDRFDRVADELDADRMRLAGREYVHDPAARTELAMLIDGILAREAGCRQPIAERHRVELGAGAQLDGRGAQPFRRARARRQGDGGDHHETRLARGKGMERARARGCHIQVRFERSIGIDLVGRACQHGTRRLRRAPSLQCTEKEPRIVHHRVDVAIGRDDSNDGRPGRQCRHGERPRRSRQSRDHTREHIEACAIDGAVQQRSK